MDKRTGRWGAGVVLILLMLAWMVRAASWQQVNEDGFGNAHVEEVSALAAFAGNLYAGGSNATEGAQIYRSPDAVVWEAVTEPGFGIPHDTAPPAIVDLEVFQGRLYASTGRGDGPGQIWRTVNGVNWAPVVVAGFADPDTVDVGALAVFNGLLYAGAGNLVNGAQIWRSYTGDSNSWEQVAPDAAGSSSGTVTGFATFDGALYAAVASEGPVQIWRSYGGSWTVVVSDGFDDGNTTMSGGLAAFQNQLYAGAGNGGEGAQLWRSEDGESWSEVTDAAFNHADNERVDSVFVYQQALYVSLRNVVTGMEVWRTGDGVLWEQVNEDGFGDAGNVGSNGSNATAPYGENLLMGTVNSASGGELWEMVVTPATYGIGLSPDEGLMGRPGETVSYTVTVTNSGNVTDTVDVSLAGNTWTTMLPEATLTVGAGASRAFVVSVTVPADAVDQATDVATVTATSQGDAGVSAAVVLTTTCVHAFRDEVFLPAIFNGP